MCEFFLTVLAIMQNKKLILFIILFCSTLLHSCKEDKETDQAEQKAYQNPSVVSYTQAIALTPDDASIYFKRSIALSNINQDELALQDLDKAISLDPQNDTYHIGKGELLFVLERYNESVLAYKKAFEINPQKIQIQLAIAKSLLMDKKLEQAQQIVDKTLKENPKYPDALFIQAQLLAARKDTTAAILELDRALRLDPYYYEASLMMAEYLAEIKNNNAIKQYLYTYSLDSADAYPLLQIGYYYEQLNDTNNAKKAYNQVIQLDKDYTDAYLRMGKLLVAQDSFPKALRMFTIASVTEPTNSQAHYLLGTMYEQLNNIDSAKLYYANALGLDPKNDLAKSAIKKLKK